MMKSMKIAGTLFLTCIIASTAFADGEYISIDDNGNMVISGPFDAIIPKPEGARVGGPAHSTPSFLNEDLRVSKAGYFADDQFVMVQIETTSAAPGTLTNTNLPVYELAGEEFRALFEFIEDQNVQIVPAVQAVQLSVVTDDGTGEGLILFMRNVPGGCGAVTAGNEADFHEAFETFVESIQDAN
jgi:hypothetical protein